MRIKKPNLIHKFIVLALLAVLVLVVLTSIRLNGSSKPRSVVEKFYAHEQSGSFSHSWELLHPYMKDKFPKASYIQDRAHVFIGHFGAESFKYEIGDENKVENWRAAKDQPLFKTAYHFEVTQIYQGKYGKFSFTQEVFVVKHKKEWRILWDYNR